MKKVYMCNSFFDFEVFTAHNIRHYYCVLYFCDINVITTLRKLNQYQNNGQVLHSFDKICYNPA